MNRRALQGYEKALGKEPVLAFWKDICDPQPTTSTIRRCSLFLLPLDVKLLLSSSLSLKYIDRSAVRPRGWSLSAIFLYAASNLTALLACTQNAHFCGGCPRNRKVHSIISDYDLLDISSSLILSKASTAKWSM